MRLNCKRKLVLGVVAVTMFAFLTQLMRVQGGHVSAEIDTRGRVMQDPPRCESGKVIAGQVLVRFVDRVAVNIITDAVIQAFSGEKSPLMRNVSDNLNIYLLQSEQFSTDALLGKFREPALRKYVADSEPNRSLCIDTQTRPNDDLFEEQWALHNSGGGISAVSAWDLTKGSKNIVVGIIDTGIDRIHPDLKENIWKGPVNFNVVFKGFHIPCPFGAGWDATDHRCDPQDAGWHGTHVAGIIGAQADNRIGVAGVNWQVNLMALKAFSFYGEGSVASVIEAIDVAIQAKRRFGVNIRVLNNSYGGQCKDCGSPLLEKEIQLANNNEMLFVASAGESQIPHNNDDDPHYPSSFKTENIVAVAWTNRRDELDETSNYGLTSVDLGAPGSQIWSTIPLTYVAHKGYYLAQGTSMSTPFVSGTAALVLSRCPTLKTAQLKKLLLDTVDPLRTLKGKTVSGGRLNAYKAVSECNKVR